MRIALIKDNKVINIIEAESFEWAQQAYPDCVVQESTPELESQFNLPPPQPSLNTQLTKYQFRKRFTMEELLKFDSPEVFLQNPTQEQLLI